MHAQTSTPTRSTTRLGREVSPARACGRRAHHTRRYVASLIGAAHAMDTHALDRLQLHARKHAHGATLGLNALARTLVLTHTR
jgi:hypothetical protein